MRKRNVLVVCGAAILAIEVLSALGVHFGLANAEAFHSLSYVLYFVAGIGGGRLDVSKHLKGALWSGVLAGGFTGVIGGIARQAMWWVFGTAPFSTQPGPWVGILVMAAITVATAATLGLFGGIVGWGVRSAVEPG